MTLLTILSRMLLLILLGFFAAQVGIITPSGRKTITDLVVLMVYPCYILNGFIKNIGLFSGGEMLFTLLVSVLQSILVLALSLFVFRKASAGRRPILRYATVVSNTAFLGLPMMENLFGSAGLLVSSIFVIPNRVNTFGIAVNFFTAKEGDGMGKRLRSMMTQPSIVTTIIGIAIVLTEVRPPEWCVNTLSSVAACSTPLAMMVIGAVIQDNLKQIRLRPLTMQMCFLRLILIPLVVYVVCRAAGLDRLLMGTAVLFAAMPAGSTVALYADKYDADVAYAGEVVLMSTLLSILTLPVWCYLCMYV